MTGPRYAVYWAPRIDTALAAFGRAWLGRDAETGQVLQPPSVRDMASESWRVVTADPAQYGFHATLKPPFRLAAGTTLSGLEDAVAILAGALAPLPPIRLHLAAVGSFLALVPSEPEPMLRVLASRCVEALDPFRAPAAAAELARRRAAGLSSRQEAMLQRWGYPYVMEEFRFHMTLTRTLAGEARSAFARALTPLADRACAAPIEVADLCLFEQASPGAPFMVRRRFALGFSASAARSA